MQNNNKDKTQNDKKLLTFKAKQLEYIINQMNNSVCKILVNNGNDIIYGTGFLCRLLLIDGNIFNSIITCNHVIDKDIIGKIKKFNILFENEKYSYKINIDDSRIVFTNKENDTTIIEIKPKDGLENHLFLEIDESLYKSKQFKDYKDETIYLLHCPQYQNNIYYNNNEDTDFSIGKIIKSKGSNIFHTCFTQKGSSGGPILRMYNYKVIGIHKGKSSKIDDLKIGNNIKTLIEDLEYKLKKKMIIMIERILLSFYMLREIFNLYQGYKSKIGPLIQNSFWQFIDCEMISIHIDNNY